MITNEECEAAQAEFEVAQRRYLLDRKAEMTVDARQWTGKPGSEWRLDDTGLSRRPVYYGSLGRSRIYATDDAAGYDVITYNFRGDEVTRSTVKTLATAFKRGVAQAETA